jgi:hypothetical protein
MKFLDTKQGKHELRRWMKILKRELQQNKLIRERNLVPRLNPQRLPQ